MKEVNMPIYKDVPVKIIHKIWHIHKLNKRVHRDFTKDYGEVPVGNINLITHKMEPTENRRGLAYAARNRRCYLRRKSIPSLRQEINSYL